MKITNIALKGKTSIFVLLFIVTLAGLMSYVGLPVESFPQIKQPVVIVAVPYPGVSPSDMETLVIDPIEKKLKELTKIKKLSSTAQEGYANITAEFESDMDIDEAVRKVREKVDQAKPDLPSDVEEPFVQEINFENIPIMLVSIVGRQSLEKLKDIAEDLQDQIEQIPGVLDVKISGGLEKEVQVNVFPNRLRYYNLDVNDVIQAIRNENLTIPGGSVESGNLKYTVRVPGEFKDLGELRRTVVKMINGQAVYLQDLAEVKFGFKEPESYSRLNQKPSVTLSIQKRSGENIINIADQTKALLEAAQKKFPPETEYYILADQSKDIRSMVNDLENNIISGLILVVFVLYFFMGTRNGLLVGIAIPLSMLLSFIVISFLGYTLNMIVLFSLILALGMLVDNAIVIVENIYRQHQEGKSLMQAAKDGTAEVGVAVVTSTITTLSAFAPMIFWPGMIGEFMRYLPVTLIITLASSLFVGLVFNPVLASSFLKIDEKMDRLPGDRLLRWLVIRYETTLKWVLAHRKTTLGMTFTAFILMFVVYGFLNHGVEFFPDLEPTQANVKIEASPGTRLETSDRIVRQVEKRIADTPDMEQFVSQVGNASDNPMDFGSSAALHKSLITIDFVEKADRSQSSFKTLDQIKQKVGRIPGARLEVSKPQDGPPTGKAVEIQIKGEDFAILDRLANQIIEKIRNVPGITDVKDNYEVGRPELRIRIDRQKAAQLGLSTGQIANTIRTAINGTEASQFRLGQDDYDITVRFKKDFRQNYNDLLNLTFHHEGANIPLANVADISLTAGLSKINHVERDRVVTVTGDALGRSSAEVLNDVKTRLAGFTLPAGYNLQYAGQDQDQKESSQFLTNAFLIALMLILFVLVAQFNSVTLPMVIMISVLLSFFGVFFGLLVTFKPFGIVMTGIGIISLAGVVVNNAIVLIDYIQKLRSRGLAKTEAIIQGGKTRLRPVILTAVTTILGLIPLTAGININFIGLFKLNFKNFIEFGAESSQWWGNMGVAVIFGLLFSTALTLIVVPTLYYIFSDALENVFARFKKPVPEVEAEVIAEA